MNLEKENKKLGEMLRANNIRNDNKELKIKKLIEEYEKKLKDMAASAAKDIVTRDQEVAELHNQVDRFKQIDKRFEAQIEIYKNDDIIKKVLEATYLGK